MRKSKLFEEIMLETTLTASQAAAFLVNNILPYPGAQVKAEDAAKMGKVISKYKNFDLVNETVNQFGGTEATYAGMEAFRTTLTQNFINGICDAVNRTRKENWYPLDAATWILDNQNVSQIKAVFDIPTANKMREELLRKGATTRKGSSQRNTVKAQQIGLGLNANKTKGKLLYRDGSGR